MYRPWMIRLPMAALVGALVVGCASPPVSSGPASSPSSAAQPAKSKGAAAPIAEAAPACQAVSDGTVEGQQGSADKVRLNQLGYLPGQPKIALVDAGKATEFKLVEAKSGKVVCQGTLGDAVLDEDSLDKLRAANFGSYDKPGTYAIVVPGVSRSPEFAISPDVYSGLFKDAVASYDVLARLAPEAFQRTRAQLKDGSGQLEVGGGWPDAGDYGRYMPTAAASVGQLLATWEVRGPQLADVKLNQASSTPSAMPDFLEVVKVELDWMLKMQRQDGGVYHKVTPENFGPMSGGDAGMGGQQFVWGTSTPDTALFAAATAKAARAYQASDPEYAQQLRAAAERAWKFLDQHQEPVLPPASGGTGAYVYPGDAPQRFWAAAELFRTTGDAQYDRHVHSYWEGKSSAKELGSISWLHPQMLGIDAYYFADKADTKLKQDMKARVLRWAEGMVNWVTSPINLYKVTLSNYAWASNKLALDNAMGLLLASQMEPNPNFTAAALDQLNYVLGRNALSKVFVTGHGANPVKQPHNRSLVNGKLVPGIIVGGPNSAAQDGHVSPGLGPKSYADKTEAYSVNENSIEYNAPLVFVTAYFALNQGAS